MIITK